MSRSVSLPPEHVLADGAKPGGWWHAADEPGRLVCDLCPRACVLRPGDRGFCFVRENREGEMVLSTYGRSTGFCIDPIEKKPLNHFYPGTSVLSFGTAGCNLACKFCQNWSISKSREIEQLSEAASPAAVARAAQQLGCRSVAFTYNDPVIWAEYAIDTAKACHELGVKTVAVTAGYITPQARGAFYEHMDAANVDLKGFTEDFYHHLTLSHLEPVLDTLRWLKRETDVWFEITNLVIPQANDSLAEIAAMCDWILEEVGPDVPLHLTAFHPDFRLRDRGATPPETLLAAHEAARSRGLKYVYVGNIPARRQQATYCPGCQGHLIERDGYTISHYDIRRGGCRHCGMDIPGRFDDSPGDWGSKRQPVRIAEFTQLAPDPLPTTMSSLPIVEVKSTPTGGLVAVTSQQQQVILQSTYELVSAAVLRQSLSPSDPTLGGAADLEVWGAFVSLKRRGRLRSCCGFLGERATLAQALAHAASRSAVDDPRFPPVSSGELPYLDAEIWLLDSPTRIERRGESRRDAVTIGRHGLQIARGEARGLLLPCVAVEHGFDAEAFLEQVCLKAGLPPTAWKEDDVTLSVFEGHAFSGPLAPHAHHDSMSRFTPAEIAGLADFCRGNMLAAARGATPSYYAVDLPDGNVNGLAVLVRRGGGEELFRASRLSLKQTLPLQATLYSLAEALGQQLGQQLARLDAPIRSSELTVEVAVLDDPAMQGTLAEPDLSGIAPTERALVAVERNRSILAFDAEVTAAELLEQAAARLHARMPQAAALYSLRAATSTSRLCVLQGPRAQAGAAVRQAAVAGQFYPADAAELSKLVDELLAGPAPNKDRWQAAMVPHAGMKYSGRIAAQTLSRIEIPETVIVLSPKHTQHGVDWAVAPHRAWSIPGATIQSDPQLARELVQAIDGLELDAAAHVQEHGIEVQLPLLARLAPTSRVVGITIGMGDLPLCRQFAAGLARVIAAQPKAPLLVISSDMNHFASDRENRRLDEMALAAMERLDAELLLTTCLKHHISMCGLLPAVIVMEALRRLDGLKEIRRSGYATSADASGDTSRVVGYAGMLLR